MNISERKAFEDWTPPNIENEVITAIEAAAVDYVGGFIAQKFYKLISECHICKQNIYHSGEPDEFQHKLIEFREHDNDVRKFHSIKPYINKKYIELYNIFHKLINTAIYYNYVRRRIVNYLENI